MGAEMSVQRDLEEERTSRRFVASSRFAGSIAMQLMRKSRNSGETNCGMWLFTPSVAALYIAFSVSISLSRVITNVDDSALGGTPRTSSKAQIPRLYTSDCERSFAGHNKNGLTAVE